MHIRNLVAARAAVVGSRVALAALLAVLAACADRPQDATTETATTDTSAVGGCDRACLEGTLDAFLQALVAGDPDSLSIAGDAVFVENSQFVPAGDGAWQTIDGLSNYSHVISDPDTQQVAWLGTATENGRGVILTLRLMVDDSAAITESELTVIRTGQGTRTYDELGEPHPDWFAIVPEEDRLGREELIAAANRYFTGMENNDGLGDYSFFHDDCQRWEHGLRTTNNEPQTYGHSDDNVFMTLTCKEQFETGFLGFVTRIRDRRFPVVDVERQVLFTHVALDHDGTIRSIPLTDGRTFEIPPYFSSPRSLMVGEAFRIEDGQVRLIEMTLTEPPYGMRPAFDVDDRDRALGDPWPGSAPPDNAGDPCDRACLQQVGEAVLDAMVANTPEDAPLAAGVRFSENEQWLDIGDGLWGTLTELGEQSLWIIDEQAGQVGWLGQTVETDVPGIFALRMKVDGRQVSEIEAVALREEIPGHDTMFRPRLLVEPHPHWLELPEDAFLSPVAEDRRASREELSRTADRYFDALLAGNRNGLSFADACVRAENGVRVTDHPEYPSNSRGSGAGGADGTVVTMWGESDADGILHLDPQYPDFNPFALDCAAQMDAGLYRYVRDIRDRRDLVIDEQHGLVFSLAHFDVPGTVRSLDVPDVGEITLPEVLYVPYTLTSPHLLRVADGRIERIESLARSLPYRMRSAWTD